MELAARIIRLKTKGTRSVAMRTWREAVKASAVSGAAASVASSIALAIAGKIETGSAVAPTNAVSHWFWGDRATRVDRPTVRHTAVGYVTHHMSATFWAVFYEKWFGGDTKKPIARALGEQAAVAALACFVDYRLTPKRLTPGFEHRLSKKSLLAVYVAFGIGLGVPALARRFLR
jgi:hypothetical protein